MKNILLIGMPGAGKSTVGVILAKTLGMGFIDTDLIIQQNEGKLLQKIIDEDGYEVFFAAEENAMMNVNSENCVVATGGSSVYSKGGMAHLKKTGITIYLKLEFEEIFQRVSNFKSRGIVMKEDQSLYDIFVERTPLYEKNSNHTIDCTGKSIEDIVDEIRQKYRNGAGQYGN